jgi:hypothetical protein
MAPHGRSGGILLGVDLSVFDIGAIAEGDFYVGFTLRCKSDGFKFVLYSIYGPAQAHNKQSFLAELANTCSKDLFLILLGAILILSEDQKTKALVCLILNGQICSML